MIWTLPTFGLATRSLDALTVARSEALRAGSVHLPDGTEVEYRLVEAPTAHFPAPVDSNSPVFRHDGKLTVFNSKNGTEVATGSSIATLTSLGPIQCAACPTSGALWLEAVWHDLDLALLYGWFHFEPWGGDCQTAPVILAATSRDDGMAWDYQGEVVRNGFPPQCTNQNGFFSGGNGDFSVIPDVQNQYFYFLFTNYAGPPEEQGIALARSTFQDRGQPGTVHKYFEGAWGEPGIDGQATAIFPTTTGWKGPVVDAFWGPSVHWNTYLEAYVVVMNRDHTEVGAWDQDGVYVTFSRDLLNWSEPQSLLATELAYPQVVGLDDDGNDLTAGQEPRLFVGGVSSWLMAFEVLQRPPVLQPPQSAVSWHRAQHASLHSEGRGRRSHERGQ